MPDIFNGKTQHESSGEAKSTDCIFYFPSPFLFSELFCLLLAVSLAQGICSHWVWMVVELGSVWSHFWAHLWGGGEGVQGAPCASGAADSQPGASPWPAWPAGSCKALTFLVLWWSQLSSKGVFGLEWGRGFCVIAPDYLDWFFFSPQAYLGRCSECSDKINMLLKVAFFQGKVFKDMLPGKTLYQPKFHLTTLNKKHFL